MSSATSPTLGPAFAAALARRDFAEIGELLHPEVEFRALTPRRAWAPEGRAEAIEVLRTWFGDAEIEELSQLESVAFADRRRVGYRFTGTESAAPFVVEQQAYYSERDGRIDWIRIVCSGFRAP
jgi:SnoaL-like domain